MSNKDILVKIIVADYYKEVSESLVRSAISFLEDNKIDYEVINVPGVYEIPQMIKWQINQKKLNLFIALGCVLKGDTYHFEVISDSVGKSLLDLVNANSKTIITNGIINAYNMKQALNRSKMNKKNKGLEASSAMLRMIKCLI
tara:strand:- start:110 stop:538 length:429 start_codon:yes stop_codon:yes gene_type:complete